MPKKPKKQPKQSDSVYFLKLVMYLLVSSMWVRFQHENGSEVPIPAGAMIALVFAMHDHFRIDRKVEYALILIGMFVTFWLPVGVFISL